jgi:hypothetical protein
MARPHAAQVFLSRVVGIAQFAVIGVVAFAEKLLPALGITLQPEFYAR